MLTEALILRGFDTIGAVCPTGSVFGRLRRRGELTLPRNGQGFFMVRSLQASSSVNAYRKSYCPNPYASENEGQTGGMVSAKSKACGTPMIQLAPLPCPICGGTSGMTSRFNIGERITLTTSAWAAMTMPKVLSLVPAPMKRQTGQPSRLGTCGASIHPRFKPPRRVSP
jgi:hypothetical protein